MNGRVATFLTTLGATMPWCPRSGPNPRLVIYGTPQRVSPSGSIGYGWLVSLPQLVAVQPPEPLATFLSERGYLPRGIAMLKRVLALSGQTVCRNRLTITVDKIQIGEARERDSRGRALPVWQGCRAVADGKVFLMNWQSADSLDGRYFGVLPMSAIIGKAEPLWTHEEE
jgi:type IV secretory pathway protease TraF